MYCVGCGQPLASAARFCGHCGRAVAARRPRQGRLWLMGAGLLALLALAGFLARGLVAPRPARPAPAAPAASGSADGDWSGLAPEEARAARRALEESIRAEEATARTRIDAAGPGPGIPTPADRKPPP
jgi:hypothetical protein